jgi:hypothetical protein
MITRKIFESRLSEMPFPGLWGEILQNSDGSENDIVTCQRPWPTILLYRLSLGAPIWPIGVGGPRVLPVWAHSSYATGLTRSLIRKITPLLILKCRFIINGKTINSNEFVSCQDKTPKTYQSSVVYEYTCPGCNSIGASSKLIAAYTPGLRNIHITQNLQSINTSRSTCEQFQHINL